MKLAYAALALLTTLSGAASLGASGAHAQGSPAHTLDAQHQALADLEGKWSVRQALWMNPGAAPKLDTGVAEFKMVLRGRHLRQTLRIADGSGFEGLGYLGFDNQAGQFFSVWMDVNFPGLVVGRGAFDPAAHAYVLRATMSGDGGDVPVREVLTIADRDHFKYEYFETRGGVETLTVRLDYTRRR